jgi:hypothetical protein
MLHNLFTFLLLLSISIFFGNSVNYEFQSTRKIWPLLKLQPTKIKKYISFSRPQRCYVNSACRTLQLKAHVMKKKKKHF